MAYSFHRSITIDHTLVPNTDQTNFPFCFATPAGTVNTAGTAVTFASGTNFQTWMGGQAILINNVAYTVQTVNSTTSITLTGSAGTQTGVAYYATPWLRTVGNGGNVQSATGLDIVFTSDSAGLSILTFERVGYSATTGQVEFHVLLSSLSHTADTVIYLQYGKAGDSDHSNASGVWDANYVLVCHFGDGTTLNVNDSTTNANNGTNHSGTAAASAAPNFGMGAVSLVAAGTQYVTFGTAASLNITGDISLQALLKPSSIAGAGTFPMVISKLDAGATNGYELLMHNNSSPADQFYMQTVKAGVVGPTWNTNIAAIANHLYMLAHRYPGTAGGTAIAEHYDYTATSDAKQSFATQAAALVGTNGNLLYVGSRAAQANLYWDGLIDEVRISKSVRLQDWIDTERAMFGNTNFWAAGAEIGAASSSLFRVPLLVGIGAGGPFFQNPLN